MKKGVATEISSASDSTANTNSARRLLKIITDTAPRPDGWRLRDGKRNLLARLTYLPPGILSYDEFRDFVDVNIVSAILETSRCESELFTVVSDKFNGKCGGHLFSPFFRRRLTALARRKIIQFDGRVFRIHPKRTNLLKEVIQNAE